jgi:hypothetical protein
MNMAILKRPWAFAILYTCISLGVEGALIVLAGLRVPQDNKLLAPVVLTVPPVLSALVAGFRRLGEFVPVALLTIVLTVGLTIVANKSTGVSTGLLEPIIVR